MTYNPLHPNAEERPGSGNNDVPLEERMTAEDLRTWSLAYKLSVEVYVCADRYLMRDFKSCIAKYIINQFEVAGLLAAQPTVLECCKILHIGLSPLDPLLKKVLARVGFLQARLWKSFPEYTSHFFLENPELATVIMREMVERREEDEKDDLPAMERSIIRQLTHDERMQGRPRRNRIWLDD
ncbi:hypothetical protein B0O99DRAFT_603496 [Bisporella sp. PMI_857]|nr:hypothetical protein B0O99DRAFT_603496 [Bisporella sp. PMI_857]